MSMPSGLPGLPGFTGNDFVNAVAGAGLTWGLAKGVDSHSDYANAAPQSCYEKVCSTFGRVLQAAGIAIGSASGYLVSRRQEPCESLGKFIPIQIIGGACVIAGSALRSVGTATMRRLNETKQQQQEALETAQEAWKRHLEEKSKKPEQLNEEEKRVILCGVVQKRPPVEMEPVIQVPDIQAPVIQVKMEPVEVEAEPVRPPRRKREIKTMQTRSDCRQTRSMTRRKESTSPNNRQYILVE